MVDKLTLLSMLNWYKELGINEIISETTNDRLKFNLNDTTKCEIDMKRPLSKSEHMLDNIHNLIDLKKAVLEFEGCALKSTATNTVFSDGNPQAQIMFIGEAPGANEDAQGIPFCGDSGKLLDNILKSIGLTREKNIYITNTVFWRPPGNRRPSDDEIRICLPFVEKHISIINPKLIVLVGATALYSLLQIKEPISKLRQKYFKYTNQYLNHEIDITPIFHPSYLLRQASQKRLMWQDLLVMQEYIVNNKIRV